MKRILVFYNWQLTIPFYGIMIDHIKETQAREGVEIHLLGCDGIIKNCINNRLNDPKFVRFADSLSTQVLKKSKVMFSIMNWITTKTLFQPLS